MSLDFKRLEMVLAEAAARTDPTERAAYLAEACGEDRELRAEVERLLAAHENAGDFLETPVRPAPESLAEAGSEKTQVLSDSDIPLEGAGAMIGRYKLLEEIGEGGFGVVYMAEQVAPVQRQVALKIVKAGMDTREVVARFEAERQALALMDHPSIARVFDGGVTQAGRPYFVMELVRGIPITEFCDQRSLSTAERLKLFIQVCHAVQHAHQKGIIHRDLKPTNILVTLIDGEPVPKVIDFGVAKALGQKLTDKTLFTGFLKMVGTPAYMSPEQADLSGADIDTRADIYALGVLLYELLTGVTPFDGETLRNAALDEIRRMIRDTEPPKPSTRLHTLGERLTEVAKHRQTEPATLNRLVRGDLDWIVMKCLEKDRGRRYDTANNLADDIERHLDHQPVSASPPGAGYRLSKFVRRHRMGVALGASVAVALVGGLAFALVGFAEARRERDRALRAEQQAETEAARSGQVAQFVKDMLKGVDPAVAQGQDTAMLKGILDQTAERLSGELAGQPEVEADLRDTLGTVYSGLSEYGRAAAMLERALALRREIHGSNHVQVARALHHLADVYRFQTRDREAEAGLREALAMRRNLLGNEHAEVAASLHTLADLLRREGTTRKEAEQMHREALALRRKLLGNEHLDVAQSLSGLGILLRNAPGKQAEAESCLREALTIRRKKLGNDHPEVAATLRNIGYLLKDNPARRAEGEALLREALAIQRKVLGEHRDTAMTLHFLASMVKDPDEAERLHREALAMRRKVLRPGHGDTASSVERLADVLAKKGSLAEAVALCREEAARVKSSSAGGGDSDEAALRLAGQMMKLGKLLRRDGKRSEAEAAFREALALHRNARGNEHPDVADSLVYVAMILVEQGKPAEAEAPAREAVNILKTNKSDGPLDQALRQLGRSLIARGNLQEAEAVIREGLAVRRRTRGNDHPDNASALVELAGVLRREGKLAELQTLVHEAAASETRTIQTFREALGHMLWELGDAHSGQQELQDAERLYEQSRVVFSQLEADYPTNAYYRQEQGFSLRKIASVMERGNRMGKAEATLRKSLDFYRQIASEQPDSGFYRNEVAWVLWDLARVLRVQGRLAEAVLLEREGAKAGNEVILNQLAWSLATSADSSVRDGQAAVGYAKQAVSGTGRTNAMILDTLAAAYAETGQFTNAVKVQKEAIALLASEEEKQDFASRLKLYTAGIPYRDDGALAKEARDLLNAGKFAEAEAMARECLALREKQIPDSWRAFNARSLLGGSLLGQKKYAEAEPLLVSGYVGMEQREDQIPAGGKSHLKEALRRLVQLYETTDQSEKAAQWRQKLAEANKAEASKQPGTP